MVTRSWQGILLFILHTEISSNSSRNNNDEDGNEDDHGDDTGRIIHNSLNSFATISARMNTKYFSPFGIYMIIIIKLYKYAFIWL